MHIIIPMAGMGDRFVKAGYKTPKPLIEVDGSPVISHILKQFPGEEHITFICNSLHIETTNLRNILQSLAPSAQICVIDPHKQGPIHTVQQVYDQIDDEKEVLVNYCDFLWTWDYQKFQQTVAEQQADGCIPAYIGFHPHSLGPNLYAYMRVEGNRVLEIKEKHCFTDNKMQEYASSGTYYFRTGALLKHYFDKTVAANVHFNQEFYCSSPFDLMCQDNRLVTVYEVDSFLQWGTPEDLEEYMGWSDVFFRKTENTAPPSHTTGNLTTIVPMAGLGKRFADEGYTTPKPLIPVSDRPMVEQVIRSGPPSDKVIVVAQKAHITAHPELKETLHQSHDSLEIIELEKLTEGQACTCLVAAEKIDDQTPLFIASCDTQLMLDYQAFEKLLQNPEIDAAIIGFTHYQPAARNPQAYGWLLLDEDKVQKVSTKKPVSETPFHDYGVVGAFYFRKTQFFVEGVKSLIEKDRRINNEFYVDETMNELIETGLNVVMFPVIHYIPWGTPDELKTYLYWQNYLHQADHHPYFMQNDPDFISEHFKELGNRI